MLTARDPLLLVDRAAAVRAIDSLAADELAVSSIRQRTVHEDGSLRSNATKWMSPWREAWSWAEYCRATATEAKNEISLWPERCHVEIQARAGTRHVGKAQAILAEFFAEGAIEIGTLTREIPLVVARLTRDTPMFSQGQSVYVYDMFWGMNEKAKVIGRYRRKHRLVAGVCRNDILDDCRPKRVMSPRVIHMLTGSMLSAALFRGRFWPMPVPVLALRDDRRAS